MLKKLINSLSTSYALYRKGRHPWPEGETGLQVRNHREMVGGKWDEVGLLQFEFLKKHGLEPHHVLCDVACGSFRAGRFFIDYLDAGNYLGIDKQDVLIREGRAREIGETLWAEKQPEVIVDDRFDFQRFSKQPDYAIANSLFSHLSTADIKRCLRNLASHAKPGCKFFATYIPSDVPLVHLHKSHSSRSFRYTPEKMLAMGRDTGWQAEYIGDWNHPRKQVMVLYTL
jgi:hypothetical protein